MSQRTSPIRRLLHRVAAGAERDIDRIEDFLALGEGETGKVRLLAFAGNPQAVRDFPDRVAAVFIRDVDGTCNDGAKAALLAEMRGKRVRSFCGADFGEAAAAANALGLDRPAEAAKAASVAAPAAA